MTPRRMPELAGMDEIAEMAGVSKQRASQLMDRRVHPDAPKGQELKRGRVWLKADAADYLRSTGHLKA